MSTGKHIFPEYGAPPESNTTPLESVKVQDISPCHVPPLHVIV